MTKDMVRHVLGQPRAVGHGLDDVLGAPRLDRERLLEREVVLQQRARTRFDIGTTRTLDFLPCEPPLPWMRSWRCCQRTFCAVRAQSSLTRRPVSRRVQTTSRSVGDWRQLEFPADDHYFSRTHQPVVIPPDRAPGGLSWPAPPGSSARSTPGSRSGGPGDRSPPPPSSRP